MQPVMIGRLLRYFSFGSKLTLADAYVAAASIAVIGVVTPFIHHPYFYYMQELGMELKVASCGMIMKKVFASFFSSVLLFDFPLPVVLHSFHFRMDSATLVLLVI